MKIFYLGMPKCGSISLCSALNILGYNAVHYKTEDLTIIQSHGKINISKGKKFCDGLDYDAFLEFRGFEYADILLNDYPDAKFIMSFRERDSWIESSRYHQESRGRWYPDDYYEDLYDTAVDKLNLFLSNNGERCLVLDYKNSQWEQLCGFLGKEIPNVEYPHDNKRLTEDDQFDYDILITSLPDMDKDKPAPGPAFLKSYLEQYGKKVKTIDGNQIGDIEKLEQKIKQYKFKWLGISVFSYMQEQTALELADKFDRVVFGGPGVTKDWKHGNYVRGEGEKALLAFLDGNMYYPGINGREPQQIDDIGNLPIPDYTDYLQEPNQYTQLQLAGSRGCVRDCTFCDIAQTWPKFKYVTGEQLAQNMHDLYDQTGIDTIAFSDSLVNGSMKQFRQLCAALAERERKIKWHGQFIARRKETFTEKDFDNLANSGCIGLTIGIESGSESVRHHMRKKFSNDDIEWFVTNIAKRGIGMKFLLIIGYPTETDADFDETMQLIFKYSPYKDQISLSIDIMRIEPHSPIETDHHDIYEGKGHDWYNQNSDLSERFERFIELFEYAEELGYSFPHHAHAKKERFIKYLEDPSSVTL